MAITGYMLFNGVVGKCTTLMLGLNNLASTLIIGMLFRKALFFRNEEGRLRMRQPQWKSSLMGALGCLLVSSGLKFTQHYLGVFATMQLVYDGFVISNSLLDLLAERRRTGHIRSAHLNLILHLLMAIIVAAHLWINWEWTWSTFCHALPFVCTAIVGYRFLNGAVRQLSEPKRLPTNLFMNAANIIGFTTLSFLPIPLYQGPAFSAHAVPLILCAAVALTLITCSLAKAYQVFGEIGLAYLVPVLVYDGLLITPAVLQMILHSHFSIGANLALTLCMVAIMVMRAPKLQERAMSLFKARRPKLA
jgi:hypothetical protein